MLNDYIGYLEEQVKNHSIYIWGAQGQRFPTLCDEWIKKKESGTHRINALKMWNKAKAAGCEKTARAFDCSGLFIYFGLNNKIVKKDMTANGIKGKCSKIAKSELKKGDFVFRTYKTTTKEHKKGQAYHIGYVVDNDLNVIHAKGRAYGVVKEKFNSSYWNYYARPEWFKEEIENNKVICPFVLSILLKKGSKGIEVKTIQKLLNEALDADLAVDGIFGKKTLKAVKSYQKLKGLKVDGIVGRNTVKALGGKWVE